MNSKDQKSFRERYKLRHAAGKYYLINMEQNSLKFEEPLIINETGADIWTFYSETGDVNGTVEKLCSEYAIDEATAVDAVNSFLNEIEDRDRESI